MKKFLTVLLALSVVFTYSFSAVGTAFAASTNQSEYDVLVEQAADQVETMIGTAYTEAVKALTDGDPGLGTTVDAEVWKANAAVYQAKIADLVDEKEAEIKKLYTDANKATLNAWNLSDAVNAFGVATGDPYGGASSTLTTAVAAAVPTTVADVVAAIQEDADVKLAVAKAYGAGLAEDAIVALKSIDTTVYSETKNATTNMNSQEMADTVIKDAITEIEKIDFASAEIVKDTDVATDDVAALIEKIGAFKAGTLNAVTGEVEEGTVAGTGILEKFVHAVNAEYSSEKYVISEDTEYKDQKLVTKDAEESQTNTLAATRASYLAKVEANYAEYLKAANADKAEAAAYKEGVSEIINAAKTLDDLKAIFANEDAIPKPTGNYAGDKEKIDDLVVLANKYIAEGYDADEINEIVAEAKVQAYKANTIWDGKLSDGKTLATDAIKAAVAAQFDTKKIDKEVAALEKALEAKVADDAASGYYAPEAEKITALYQGIIDEIKACKSDDDIAAVKTKYAATADWESPTGLSKIDTKAKVVAAIKKTLTGDTGWNNNLAAVKAYAEYLNAGLTEKSDQRRNFVGAGMLTSDDPVVVDEAWLADFYAEKGARTTAEAYAMIADAKAALEAVPTAGAVKTAAAAVEAQINALPAASAITADDAAAVEAAQDAYDKFHEETGGDISATAKLTLSKAVNAAGNAAKLALLKEINAYRNKDVTDADKADLKALLEKVEAFNEKTANGKIYAGKTIESVDVNVVKGKLADIRNAAKKAVEKAIAALPVTVTKDNVDKVDAAKKLYDDYVATYTDFYTPLADVYNPTTGLNQNAANDFTDASAMTELKNAVKAAEKVKAEVAAKEEAELKLAIEGTHMKIYSSAKKGYIKISWKKSNSEVALDGVEVYRSTKKTSGFKKISTFKKQTAKKYTKNMKKGTKYYFYVKGYKMVGDEKVYTHNSIKVARTFRK